jgi:hypothetical protein
MSVANKRSYDLEACVNSAKHKKQILSCRNIPKVSEFFIKQNSEAEGHVIATEGSHSLHAPSDYLPHTSINSAST